MTDVARIAAGPWTLVIRQSDQKCCAERQGKRITNWLKDHWAVAKAVERHDARNHLKENPDV